MRRNAVGKDGLIPLDDASGNGGVDGVGLDEIGRQALREAQRRERLEKLKHDEDARRVPQPPPSA